MLGSFHLGPMTVEEDREAVEAQVRTVVILNDALNKRNQLLEETGVEYGDLNMMEDCPLIHTQLVEDLRAILQHVTLLKDNSQEYDPTIASVYPGSTDAIIGLGNDFWERAEYLRRSSRPGVLILAAANILGYRDYPAGCMGEHGRRCLKASDICAAFEIWMNHTGTYSDGSYTCCGEVSRDSVCEQSEMRSSLTSRMTEEQKKLSEQARQTALNILFDAQKKNLLVGTPYESHLEQCQLTFPVITTDLVWGLIPKLQAVTFKRDNSPENKATIAYNDPSSSNVIYLCPLFWKEKEYLSGGSRPGTLILNVAQMLGYSHILNSANQGQPEETGQHKMGSLTADYICSAFEEWMNHQKEYQDGSYSCCGETARDSVCENSIMRSCLGPSMGYARPHCL